jgi:hypothetical protein
MGYYYGGGTCYWYDDATGTPDHASPPLPLMPSYPHTLAEGVLSAAWSPYLTNPYPGVFVCTKPLRAGDAVLGHVATTTLESHLGEILVMNPAGSITSGAQNQAGLRWQLGTKVGQGEAVGGVLGLVVRRATTISIFGDFQVYGCSFETTSAQAFVPWDSITSPTCELVGNTLRAGSVITVGTPANPVNLCAYNDFVNASGSPYAVWAVASSFGNRFDASSLTLQAFFRAVAAGLRIVRSSFAWDDNANRRYVLGSSGIPYNWFVVEPTWPVPEIRHYQYDYNANQLAFGGQHFEMWGLHAEVMDAFGNVVSGIPVTLTDTVTGQVQADTVTDALGDISFGNDFDVGYPLAGNYVIVADVGNWQYPGATDFSFRYRGPFLLEVNAGPLANPAYGSVSMLYHWPYTGSSRKNGQMHPIRMPITLPAPGTQVVIGPYTRRSAPATPYVHADQPSTPYALQTVPSSPYSRVVDPSSAYAPCPSTPGSAAYGRQSGPVTSFTRKPVPAVDYSLECGEPEPDRVILLGPWMPMPIPGGS